MSELKLKVQELEELSLWAQETKRIDKIESPSRSRVLDTAIPVEDQLWVDKYAPQSFLDLLSDDKTNRNILSWLKEWDPYVFKVLSSFST
jgi:hypothetical protein